MYNYSKYGTGVEKFVKDLKIALTDEDGYRKQSYTDYFVSVNHHEPTDYFWEVWNSIEDYDDYCNIMEELKES